MRLFTFTLLFLVYFPLNVVAIFDKIASFLGFGKDLQVSTIGRSSVEDIRSSVEDIRSSVEDIVLRSKDKSRDCELRINVPKGSYDSLSHSQSKALGRINACIDPKQGSDKRSANAFPSVTVDSSPTEKIFAFSDALRESGLGSMDDFSPEPIFRFRDLIGAAEVAFPKKERIEMLKYTCFNNPVDSKELSSSIAMSPQANDLSEIANLGDRRIELEDWKTPLRSFATYIVPSDLNSNLNPIKYKRSWFQSTAIALDKMFPQQKQKSDTPIVPMGSTVNIDARTGRKFCNVMLARTKQVYDILFGGDAWKGKTSSREFVYSMLFHPDRLLNTLWVEELKDHRSVVLKELSKSKGNAQTKLNAYISTMECYFKKSVSVSEESNDPDIVAIDLCTNSAAWSSASTDSLSERSSDSPQARNPTPPYRGLVAGRPDYENIDVSIGYEDDEEERPTISN